MGLFFYLWGSGLVMGAKYFLKNKTLWLVAFFIMGLMGPFAAHGSELDQKLSRYIEVFQFAAIKPLPRDNKALYYLGAKLFSDRRLSSENNISCRDCHHHKMGSGDNLPLGVGTGAVTSKGVRYLHHGKIVPRNSPALYNKGHKEFQMMFWDARIFYNSFNDSYTTPEPGLNGEEPEYSDIKAALSGPLAAQALFPLVSEDEMLGSQKTFKGNRYYWDKIVEKILSFENYREHFAQIWPGVKINIGHFASAIAYFESRAFEISRTPWDQYLRGDKSAMSDGEKKGALAFVEKGLCARCHNGVHLTNFTMHNAGIPSIGPGIDGQGRDYGRYHVQRDKNFLFRFVTPGLRNIAKTAPYFHNGSMVSLKSVIEHYRDIPLSFKNYTGKELLKYNEINYQGRLKMIKDQEYKDLLLSTVSPPFRMKLDLSDEDISLIELFLTKSLSE